MTVTFAFIAGLFAGAFALSCAFIYFIYRNLKESDTERKRWINKALVRDGQATLFPASDIAPDEVEHKPSIAKNITSPFRRGKVNLAETLKTQDQKEAGTWIPDNVKASIMNKAERLRENA